MCVRLCVYAHVCTCTCEHRHGQVRGCSREMEKGMEQGCPKSALRTTLITIAETAASSLPRV